MVRFAVELPEELNKEFRRKVLDVYDSEKGAITKAITAAIQLWVRQDEPRSKKK